MVLVHSLYELSRPSSPSGLLHGAGRYAIVNSGHPLCCCYLLIYQSRKDGSSLSSVVNLGPLERSRVGEHTAVRGVHGALTNWSSQTDKCRVYSVKTATQFSSTIDWLYQYIRCCKHPVVSLAHQSGVLSMMIKCTFACPRLYGHSMSYPSAPDRESLTTGHVIYRHSAGRPSVNQSVRASAGVGLTLYRSDWQ